MPRTSDNARRTALEVVTTLEVVERVRAPDNLTDEQREVFVHAVNSVPADWFNASNLEALCAYSRHVCCSRHIAALIERAIADGGEGLDDLLKAQARESRMILQCMTALRLTSRAVEPRSVSIKRLSQAPSPWSGWKRELAKPRSPAPPARPRDTEGAE